MKVIFLDVDGVLNNDKTKSRTPTGWLGVSTTLVNKLKRIISETGAVTVLSSTWKHSDKPDLDYLYSKLGKKATPIDRTYDPDDRDSRRGAGINDYLKNHQDVSGFVILDDYSFDFREQNLLPHTVLTQEHIGLTDNDVHLAIDILNEKLLAEDYYKEKFMEWGYHHLW